MNKHTREREHAWDEVCAAINSNISEAEFDRLLSQYEQLRMVEENAHRQEVQLFE